MSQFELAFERAFECFLRARQWRETSAPLLAFALKGKANGALARLWLFPIGAGKVA